jgi:hypothetical protein
MRISPLLLALALAFLPLHEARPDDEDEPPAAPVPEVHLDWGGAERDPNSPDSRAATVIGGGDAEYAALRERLLQAGPREALAVLDALRDMLRFTGRPLCGLPATGWLSEEPLTDARSKQEGLMLERSLAGESPWTVRVQAYFVRIEAQRAAALLGTHAPGASGSVCHVPTEVVTAIRGGLGAASAVRLDGPRADALAGQTVTLISTGRVRYLMDYEVSGSNTWTKEILVGALETGVRVLVTATQVPEASDQVAVDVVLQRALPMPTTTFKTSLRPQIDEDVTLQLPEVRMHAVAEKLVVPADSWILACGPRSPDESEIVAAVLHVSRAPPPTPAGAVPAPR